VTEQAQKQLFEEVLTNMHMSPEEEIYIRKTIKNTNNGLEKLFTSQFIISSKIEKSFLFGRIKP
jgi:hypothetical protein